MTEFEQQALDKLDKIAQIPENIIQLNENMLEEMRQRFHGFKGYDESVVHMTEAFHKLMAELKSMTFALSVYSKNIEVLNVLTSRMKETIETLYEGKKSFDKLNGSVQ